MQTPTTFAALLTTLSNDAPLACEDFVTSPGTVARDTHAVVSLALRRGSQLIALGLRRGDRVGLVVTEPAEFLPLIHGCLLFGLVAVPVYPPPLFSRSEVYTGMLRDILETSQAAVVVVDAALKARFTDVVDLNVVEVSQLPEPAQAAPSAVEPADLALLQFTSGSTTRPRGVRITHEALMANVRAIMVDGLQAGPGDRGVSWLPLYHDMGLIGFGLAPLLTRTPVTFIPTARFVRQPSVWLTTLSETRATITFAPNFAYSLVTRRGSPEGLDLSHVRLWGCGAEPVSEKVLAAFESKFAEAGVKPRSVAPCYGLAEATLAVTFTALGSKRVSHDLDASALETRGEVVVGHGGGLTVVACGSPLPGYSVRIVDDEDRDAKPNQVGEVVVRGPSLGRGYEGDPAESARVFSGHELRTGDRGFTRDGMLFITGRIKDVVIMNGRKYDAHVLEEWAELVPGVRRAAAVGLVDEGGEGIVMLAESTDDPLDLKARVSTRLASNIGLQVSNVLVVAPGSLPRTTSGKLRRGAARALASRLLSEESDQNVPSDDGAST